ncbi:hypothetical protein B0O80DRAFT_170708 [Mortierella sp. GBAus27b]|nr:hypothetical protein B0O80DRAFT_170708 [Mortierella sp. GBAus27b]
MQSLPILSILFFNVLYSSFLISNCSSTTIIPATALHHDSGLSTLDTHHQGAAASSVGSPLMNSVSRINALANRSSQKLGRGEGSDDDDDDHTNPANECAPNECRNQAIACHEQSLRACQVMGRRRDACREKFSRRCHWSYVQCQQRCLTASNPDLGNGKVWPLPPWISGGAWIKDKSRK